MVLSKSIYNVDMRWSHVKDIGPDPMRDGPELINLTRATPGSAAPIPNRDVNEISTRAETVSSNSGTLAKTKMASSLLGLAAIQCIEGEQDRPGATG
jgi:hypothetical protein